MMSLQVLLSAMFLDDESYIDTLKITSDCVLINQCDRECERVINRQNIKAESQRVVYTESVKRGLSLSRNEAIARADADILILCDNDVVYVDNYDKLIEDSFVRHPDADVIVFYIRRKEKPIPNFPKEKRMGYLSVLKIFSPEIAFRRENVSDIRFDERFGAGAKYIMGEENLFLYECLRKHKKIYYEPIMIAELKEVKSSWYSGHDERFFISRGANYAGMSALMSIPLIIQYGIRKRGEYGLEMSTMDALKYMFRGRREYLKDENISDR